MAVTDDEAAELIPSGRITVLQCRAHWVRTYLSKAGLLESPRRNLHVITGKGRDVLAAKAERIDIRFLDTFESFRDWRVRASSEPAVPESCRKCRRPLRQLFLRPMNPIRFVGSLTGEGANKGVFVTTLDFSREATTYVVRVQHRIRLINGQRLAALMIQYGVGGRVRGTYTIQTVDEDCFSDSTG
ncbi:winged helix-turn-helix domain-containing protein [Cereibacter sphaeroides]|uniref:winged helix-turn-helix domain-containing protein n=1 Tax=Cereibacter sphaeroides TaxID=1063 RepID=UPI0015FD9CDC|nr:winged helix-turn-helix domain-containing protein [Cereibacter sphaeroides]